jgi:CheY-like chemotaxis protein
LTVQRCKSILIVEDDTDIRESIEELLRSEGYSVFTAANGKEALETLEKSIEQPCLCFLDLMMPVCSGWQLLELLKQKRYTHLSTMPIYVISAAGENSMKAASEQTQVSGLVRKPVDIEDFLGIVQAHCTPLDRQLTGS